ncbi:hypothetical protein HII31_03297 [Pseudocercospora fuligena]|uniref:Uncharacterized protein n=1 Tax=Pseudocercospora fuligena TaxID=685502 RepID=A0A8H6RP48_9PEZI|nr:hypothetical protein HII31_03297 [Pseudocercospora fuligena]
MAAMVASILTSQSKLQQALATGGIPVHEEVSLRAEMADVLCKVGHGINNSEMLEGAVQHYETILRCVPARSTEQIRYLESLAGAKTTQYMITGASQPLTQAVQFSQRARQLCTEYQVEVDLELRSKVINTLAFAVSRRSALMGDPLESSDLDDAIAYTRELLSMASNNSQLANVARNNLASQLRRKFNQCQDVAYLQEAQDILAKTLTQSSVLEPMLNAMVQAQLGEIAYDKYEKTKKADDLRTALDCLKTGLSCLQAQHDTRHDALGRLV